MSQPLRLAYISIVIALHEARLAASSSSGLGPASVPPWSDGLVGHQAVPADLDVVLQGAAGAACGCSQLCESFRVDASLPWNSSGLSSSVKRAIAYTASEQRFR